MTKIKTSTLRENGSEPLVSVVLPVYNGARFLREAIDSILAQSFPHFELIMIDDGSTDESPLILREYEKNDSRVRVVVRENRGLATTLNDSINIACGTWVARMDQDDIALPHRFERQLEMLKKTGADIAGSWVQRFGTSDRRVVRLYHTDEAIKMEMLFGSPFAHPTVMMRTALVKQLRYDSAWEKAEDYDLWERAAEAGWKMTNVPEILLRYRVHESQISTITALRQHQLTNKIRQRYWVYFFDALQTDKNKSSITEVLNMYADPAFEPNMSVVNAVLADLIKDRQGLVQDVVLAHALRLYSRLAANCPDIVSIWVSLNRSAGRKPSLSSILRLWLLRCLRIRSDDQIFVFLRKVYIAFVRIA